jgi:DHA1 family multidrug resistance protein-like MFS transporter
VGWRRNFVLVWVNNFVTAVGMMAFLPFWPLYLGEVGVEDPRLVRLWSGLLVAGAPLTAVFMAPVWGVLGDRIGRKWMMLRANLAICLFVGCMSLVATPWLLLLLRLGQGVFSGFVAPSLTLVSVSTPKEKQGQVTGLLHTAVLAGGACGPLLGGFVSHEFGHRWVFVVCASLSAAAFLVTFLFVREPASSSNRSGQQESLKQRLGADLAEFLARGPFRALLISVFIVRFGAALIEPTLALFVRQLLGDEEARVELLTGWVASALAVATLVFAPFWGRWGDRIGYARLLTICSAGCAVLYLAQGFASSVNWLYGLRFAGGAFLAGIVPTAYAMAAQQSSQDRRGSAFGLAFSSLGLANALGPLMGGVLAASMGLRPMFLVAAALMAVACVRLCFGASRSLDAKPYAKGSKT